MCILIYAIDNLKDMWEKEKSGKNPENVADVRFIAYLCLQTLITFTIMCTYTFTLDDRLVDKISHQFKGQEAMHQWLQQELELLIAQRAENTANVLNPQDKELARKRVMELTSGMRKITLTDLKGIMAGATHSVEDYLYD